VTERLDIFLVTSLLVNKIIFIREIFHEQKFLYNTQDSFAGEFQQFHRKELL